MASSVFGEDKYKSWRRPFALRTYNRESRLPKLFPCLESIGRLPAVNGVVGVPGIENVNLIHSRDSTALTEFRLLLAPAPALSLYRPFGGEYSRFGSLLPLAS